MGTSGGLVYFSILKNDWILSEKLEVQLERTLDGIYSNFFLWQERELRPITAKWLFQDRTAEPRHQSTPSAVSAACHCPLGEDVNKISVKSKTTNSTLSCDFCPFYPKNASWVHAGLYTLPPSFYSWSYHHSQSDCGCLQGFSLLRASSSLVIHSLPPKSLLKNLDRVISLPCINFISESLLPVGFLNMVNKLENRSMWVWKWCYLYRYLLFFQIVTLPCVCGLAILFNLWEPHSLPIKGKW